jgi:hypothetical protein
MLFGGWKVSASATALPRRDAIPASAWLRGYVLFFESRRSRRKLPRQELGSAIAMPGGSNTSPQMHGIGMAAMYVCAQLSCLDRFTLRPLIVEPGAVCLGLCGWLSVAVAASGPLALPLADCLGPSGRFAAASPLDRPSRTPVSAWRPALRAAGLPMIHFHDLRHTGNQLAAHAGAKLRELMDRMGHSTTRAAMAYLRGSDQRQQAILGGPSSPSYCSSSANGWPATPPASAPRWNSSSATPHTTSPSCGRTWTGSSSCSAAMTARPCSAPMRRIEAVTVASPLRGPQERRSRRPRRRSSSRTPRRYSSKTSRACKDQTRLIRSRIK